MTAILTWKSHKFSTCCRLQKQSALTTPMIPGSILWDLFMVTYYCGQLEGTWRTSPCKSLLNVVLRSMFVEPVFRWKITLERNKWSPWLGPVCEKLWKGRLNWRTSVKNKRHKERRRMFLKCLCWWQWQIWAKCCCILCSERSLNMQLLVDIMFCTLKRTHVYLAFML